MTMLAEPPAPATTPGRISVREYFSAQQEHYSKADARAIGPELERLSAEGKTKPRDIVDAARPAASPLHPHFEWDDRRAAEGFRQMQAGRMARAIMVRTMDGGQESKEPAFRPITVKAVASRQMKPVRCDPPETDGTVRSQWPGAARDAREAPPAPVAAVSEGPERTSGHDDELIGEALRELHAWEKKYRRGRSHPCFESIFAPVFAAIAEARARDGGTMPA